MIKILRVESFDWTMNQDDGLSRYRKEYRGKIVVGNDSIANYISEDGTSSTFIFPELFSKIEDHIGMHFVEGSVDSMIPGPGNLINCIGAQPSEIKIKF